MGDIRKIFETDKSLEKEGVWVPYGDDIEFKIARTGNPASKREYQKLIAPYGGSTKVSLIGEKIANKITLKVVAKTLLVDWRNVQENEKTIPYDIEKAFEYLEKYPDLLSFVMEISQEMAVYKSIGDEEAEGNSEATLSGRLNMDQKKDGLKK